MKRLLTTIAFCILIIGLVNCEQKNTPSSVTGAAVKCLQKKDFKGYLSFAILPEETIGKEEMVASAMEQMVGGVLEEKGGLKEYEILDESIDKNKSTAIVKVKYIYGDNSEYIQLFSFSSIDSGFSITFAQIG